MATRTQAENNFIKEIQSSLSHYGQRLLRFKLGLAAIIVLVVLFMIALVGPMVITQSPTQINFMETAQSPSIKHWLGTDANGRDVLARMIYGGRVSLLVSSVAVMISTSVGIALGSLSGFYGGWVDAVIMRCTDALLAIPNFLLILVVLSVFGSSLTNIVAALGLTSWPTVTRLVRSDFLRYRETEFVEAASAIGASNRHLIFRHILPQVISPVIVASSTMVGSVVLIESALSYLGLGVQPPAASWGNMLSNAQAYMWTQPMLAVYPGVALVITVMAYNYAGEALRRVLDVRGR